MLAYAPRASTPFSRKTLMLVIGLHGIGLASLMMFRPDISSSFIEPRTEVRWVPEDIPPPPDPVPTPKVEAPVPTLPTTIPRPIIETPVRATPVPHIDPPVIPVAPYIGTSTVVLPDPGPPPLELRRTQAELLTSPDKLRPPYPESERRRGEEASLRLRLQIDARGRVTSVDPVGQAEPSFLRAADRHIRKVWRFKPATEGGKQVASEKVVTLKFELAG